jgi:hypothetical protein
MPSGREVIGDDQQARGTDPDMTEGATVNYSFPEGAKIVVPDEGGYSIVRVVQSHGDAYVGQYYVGNVDGTLRLAPEERMICSDRVLSIQIDLQEGGTDDNGEEMYRLGADTVEYIMSFLA